jgi:hypothetical protein
MLTLFFLKVIDGHIAGDPMNADIRWLKLTRQEIVLLMKQEGIKVSHNIVRTLLKKHKFVKRKMLGKIRCGDFAERNLQFEVIHKKLEQFRNSPNPIISMDTKKKEPLGKIYRAGKVYCSRAIEVYDHTNDTLIKGTAIPHGIYDLKTHKAYINIGTTHETADFLCDSLKDWWEKYEKESYPKADEILIFCDSGGANSWRINVFKFELQKLCNSLSIKITICHYPPYASKWNPIEHRVFPHITRTMEGLVLESHEQVQSLIENTTTRTGLCVTVNIIKKVYTIGRVVVKKALETINIKYDDIVPGLNYSISPETT